MKLIEVNKALDDCRKRKVSLFMQYSEGERVRVVEVRKAWSSYGTAVVEVKGGDVMPLVKDARFFAN
jgi:hypothetical protein